MPNISVIIAAYNAEKTIKRAIDSVLNDPNVAEIIVVDDASTDRTADTAKACDNGTGRVKVLVQDKNAGPSAARNRALRESSAPWVTILDSDDFMLDGRLAGLLAASDSADFIADDMFQVDENNITGPRRQLLGSSVTLPMTVNFSDFVLSNVTQKNRERAELGFIKPLIRRSFLENNHIIYRENMRLGEDFELYARSLALGAKMVILPAQGYVSVVRESSLSSTHSEYDLLQLRECDSQLLTDLNLSNDEQHALRAHYLSIDCRLQWRNLILAVKDRNIIAAIKCFIRPLPVPLYLIGQLWEQVQVRIFKTKKS